MFTSYIMANNFLFSQLAKHQKIGNYGSYCTQIRTITNALLNFSNKKLYFTSELLTIAKHKLHHKTEAHGELFGN